MERNSHELLGAMTPLVLIVIVGVTVSNTLFKGTAPLFGPPGAQQSRPVSEASSQDEKSEGKTTPNGRYLLRNLVPALTPLATFLGAPLVELDSDNDLVVSEQWGGPALELLASDVVPWLGDGACPAAVGSPASDDIGTLRTFGPRLVTVFKQRAKARNVSVRFVVATLPDYVDSNNAWLFDQMLDAIQHGARAGGYAYDSHFLPEVRTSETPEKGLHTELNRLDHELVPGSILFRKIALTPNESAAHTAVPPLKAEVLLVLVVPETATAGVHPKAMTEALELVHLWGADKVDVLGPTFSGSAYSLREALARHADAPECGPYGRTPRRVSRIRVVSGSATSQWNPARLSAGPADQAVLEFEAASTDDQRALERMIGMLAEINPDWRTGKGVAILSESTGWGMGISQERSLLPEATRIAFPMHISRLRSQAASMARDATALAPTLRLADEREPKDQLPPMTADLTSGMADTALAGIFSTLRSEGVTAVGLFATDKRDHLFLAQEMARRAPDVFVFALEGNLLYLHPGAAAFIRGTLVASSYPLFARTQNLDTNVGFRSFTQFTTPGSQGVYNAMATLLDIPREKRLDNYKSENCGPKGCAEPSVWISVVGRDAFWPVASPAFDTIRDDKEYFPGHPARRRATAFLAALLGLAILTVGLLLVPERWLGRTLSRRLRRALRLLLPPRRDGHPNTRPGDPAVGRRRARTRLLGHEYRITLVAAGGAVLTLTLWFSQILIVAWRQEWALGAWGSVRDALLFGFLVLTVWSFWPVMKDLLRRLRASGRVAFGAMTERDAVLAHEPVALLRFVPLGFGLFALWYFRLYLDGAPWQEGRQLFHVERALAIESFVSPTPVVVLLCGTVFWWAIWNMRRIYLGATAYDETAGIIQFLDLRGRAERRPFVRVLNDPVLRVGRDAWLWIILAVAVVLPFVVAWRTGSAVDGQAFGRFLWWGSLLVLTILSHTLVNIVHVGRTLLGLLRSLGRHGIAPTFAAIHDEPLNWRLSFHALRPGDAEPLFTRMRTLVREVDHATNREVSLRGTSDIAEPVVTERRRSGSGEAHASATDRTAGRLMEIRADDVALFHGQLATHNERSRPGHPFVERRQLLPRTVAWQLSSRMSGPLIAWLERCFWSQPKRLRDSDLTPVHDEAQRLIALQAALVIRDLLTRLTSSCTMVVGGFVLLTGSHLFYSFQGRRIWLTLDWSYLVFASTAILLLLIRLDKTTVIKHLWGLQEGRINWSSGFAYRILAYGAIPVVTLFATIFPELGSSVLTWLEPVRKALP